MVGKVSISIFNRIFLCLHIATVSALLEWKDVDVNSTTRVGTLISLASYSLCSVYLSNRTSYIYLYIFFDEYISILLYNQLSPYISISLLIIVITVIFIGIFMLFCLSAPISHDLPVSISIYQLVYIYIYLPLYYHFPCYISLYHICVYYCYHCHFHSYLQYGETALILASRYGKEKSVELLLAHRDVDINCSDNVSDSVDLRITVLSALFFLPLSLYLNISLLIVVSISMYQSLSISIYQLVYICIYLPVYHQFPCYISLSYLCLVLLLLSFPLLSSVWMDSFDVGCLE